MRLSREERRRLDEVAEQLRRQDPELSRALSDPAVCSRSGSVEHAPIVRPFVPWPSPEDVERSGRWLPRTGHGLTNLVGGVAGASLVAASIPAHAPTLLGVGVAVAAMGPLFQLALRRRRPNTGKGPNDDR